jgi:hypothetical protein
MPVSRTARLAWIRPGSCLAVAALGWGSVNIVDVLAHERHDLHVEYAQAIHTIDIDADKGSVHVIGTDDPKVTLDAKVSEGLRSGSHREQLDGDRLVLRARCPAIFATWCGVDYTIRVPRGTAIVADTSGDGIDVTGVTGDLNLSSSGGGVHVVGASGSLDLRSSGGGVNAEQLTSDVVIADSSGGGVHLDFTEPPRSVKASSSGGGVTVEVPNTPGAYQVNASSSGGGVDTEVRTDPSSPNVIDADSSGGGVTIRYPTS